MHKVVLGTQSSVTHLPYMSATQLVAVQATSVQGVGDGRTILTGNPCKILLSTLSGTDFATISQKVVDD